VWDLIVSRLATNLVCPETTVFGLGFSARGGLLGCAAASVNGDTVRKLWAVAGWREINLQRINLQSPGESALSPDERTLALGYRDGTGAWWNILTGKRQVLFDCHYWPARLKFSPDGKLFATAGLQGQITVWDAATRRAKFFARSQLNELHDLAFSPDGQRLIAAGTSAKDPVKLWDLETGRDVATLPGKPGWFAHIGFSPDGNTLFATSMEGTTLLWHAPSWEEIEAVQKRQGAP
jgi:WD40 repeat protein